MSNELRKTAASVQSGLWFVERAIYSFGSLTGEERKRLLKLARRGVEAETQAAEIDWLRAEVERLTRSKAVADDLTQQQSDLALKYVVELNEAAAEVARLAAENEKLRAALEWYGEQARLCRLIHSEGDAGRKALADDGGLRALTALQDKSDDPPESKAAIEGSAD